MNRRPRAPKARALTKLRHTPPGDVRELDENQMLFLRQNFVRELEAVHLYLGASGF